MTVVLAPEVSAHADIKDINVLDMFRINPRSRQPALLVRRDGSEYPVVITEFSESGFRVSIKARPDLGEDIHIRLDGWHDTPGKIRWAHGTEAGGSF